MVLPTSSTVMEPLAGVVCEETVRTSLGSGSLSLASTGIIVAGVSSLVMTSSLAATGASLTSLTVMKTTILATALAGRWRSG